MSNLRASLSPQTWRVLGLSVAASYTGLGLFGILAPARAASLFGMIPTRDQNSDQTVASSMVLLGARDLSIGAALLTFHWNHMPHSMGVVILSGLILCAVDVAMVWSLRGSGWASMFAAGASIWGVIGVALVSD